MYYHQSSYPYWGDHGTVGLLKAISHLEKYPNFESIIPKLKKELESRFKEVTPNKKGVKVIGNIRYYPSGYCEYKNMYNEGGGYTETTLSPFKMKIKREDSKPKRKISQTKLMYRRKFSNLPLIYLFCAYDEVGMKFSIKRGSNRHFDEKEMLIFLDKEKQILEQNIPDNIKKDLLSHLKEKSEGHWKYRDDDTLSDVYIRRFMARILGNMEHSYKKDLVIGPTLIEENDYYYESYSHSEKVVLNINKKYKAIFPLPIKEIIKQIAENGHLPRIEDNWNAEKQSYVHKASECQVAVCEFDTFKEFISQFKDLMYSLKNPSIIKIMKKIGLEVEENREIREIKDVRIMSSQDRLNGAL